MSGKRILGLMLMSTSLIASAAYATATGWKISEASTGVTVTRDGRASVGSRGGTLETGDVISTGSNARAVIVNGEQYAVIAPNSRLEISPPSAGGSFVQFFERLGNVVFSVKKKANPHFGVKTPYLAAVVKGTTFSVTVDAAGASVQVVEGAVEVSTLDGGARDLVLPGNIALVGASDLGQLTVRGAETKIIKSPDVPTATFSEPGQSQDTVSSAEDDRLTPDVSVDMEISEQTAKVEGGAASAPTATPVVINFAVVEAPKSLAAITDGMVSGSTGAEIAVAASGVTPADLGNAEEHGNGNGNGGGNGNGNGGGNGNGNGGGNGNGNGGGNGNGNGGGNGNGNGGGNGDGNGGGNGNGNGGGNGDGNGGGNGNGNGGGNGNGNGGGNGNGNGGGNGNGNGGGNGNGNGGGNGNGNGGGNGNGNGGGNGNGNGGGNGNGNGGGNGNGNGGGNGNGNGGGNGNGNGGGNGNGNGGGNGNGNGGGNGNGNGGG